MPKTNKGRPMCIRLLRESMDPIIEKSVESMVLPEQVVPKARKVNPAQHRLCIDMAGPKCSKSNENNELPKRLLPATDMVKSTQAYDRTGSDEAITT